jgi:protease-4
MTPEAWQAYQNQAQADREAVAGSARPLKTRGTMNWPMAILLMGLAANGGCAYTCGHVVDSVNFQPARAAEPSVGVLVLEEEITGSIWVTEALGRFQDDDNIKSVVLRINSPGGAVAPCQEIHRAVKALKKPVVASMGSVAASGGLYVAAGGDVIMANPGTLTGSIGVSLQNLEIAEALDKVGLKSQTIKSGPFKDIGSPFREMRPEEKYLLQTMVEEVYEQFLADLAAGRPKLTPTEVRQLADGRVFSGAEAQRLGLVDELGGFEDAARLAATMGGLNLGPGERPKLNVWDGRPGWWELLRGRLALSLPPVLRPGFSLKYIYQPNLGN